MYLSGMELDGYTQHKPGWWSGGLMDTRDRILLAAFNEIHLYGYQSASIQNIIDHASVIKGVLYHHFRSKHELAVALLDEVHAENIKNTFIRPMTRTADPVSSMIETLYMLKDQMSDEGVALGRKFQNFDS